MFIDTHCHLDDPLLSGKLPEVIANARLAGIDRFVVPGVGPGGWGKIAALADENNGIFTAFGLHPMHASRFHDGLLPELARYGKGAVALGEIGLDYLLRDVPREQQLRSFRCQLQLAVKMGLPVLIHCRRAFHDLLGILREESAQEVGGIMHAFSGSIETARECINLGFAISVAGPVTYINAVKPVELVKKLPLEHLVLETDSPDMTPEPFRGVPNQPSYLLETAKKVAEIKGITIEAVAMATSTNACRVLHI